MDVMRRGWCWGGRVSVNTYTCRRSVQACQCHTDPEYPCSAPVSHRTVPERSSCWQAGRPRTCTRVPLVFATLPDTCVMFTQPCSQPHHHDATGSAPPQTMFTSTHTVSHVFSVHGQHDQPPGHLIVSNDGAESSVRQISTTVGAHCKRGVTSLRSCGSDGPVVGDVTHGPSPLALLDGSIGARRQG